MAGVGVFALRQIPCGVDPFVPANSHLLAREISVPLTQSELNTLPSTVREHLLDFFAAMDDPADPTGGTPLRTSDGQLVYGIHACGPNVLDVSWFVNHCSAQPNLEFVHGEESERGDFNTYRTMRTISAGEELLHDYRASFPFLHQRCAPQAAATTARDGVRGDQAHTAEGKDVLGALRSSIRRKISEHQEEVERLRRELDELESTA